MAGHVVIATGFNQEVACLKGLAGIVAIAGGGDQVALRCRLDAAAVGAAGVVSFGMTGALRDGLSVGDWIVADRLSGAVEMPCDPAWIAALLAALPDAHRGAFFADGRMIHTVAEKLELGRRHDALAVDMESHVAGQVAADHGLPFAIVRCVSDGARHLLPPAITVSMRPDGGVNLGAMLASLGREPRQLADVVRTSAHFARAIRALRHGARAMGDRLALPA